MQITTQQNVSEFVSLITKGIECWQKAGEMLVKMLDEDGLTIEQIASHSEYLTEDIVLRFEQLGRKMVIPQLLVSDYPAARHLIKLPFSEQHRLHGGNMELLVFTDRGPETLLTPTASLTPQQCRQVFDKTRVRSLASQRAWLEEQRQKMRTEEIETVTLPYRIHGKRVVFTANCEMSSSELARILSELTK